LSVADALREAAARLAATSDSARLDAELLMADALGASRSDLLLRHMHETVPARFADLIDRRAQHEPVAYILGHKEFFGRAFAVSPAVLIPRMDSETTVATALEAVPAPRRVLDCGVGSGALLLTVLAENEQAQGVGIDRSPAAIAVADANAATLGLAGRVELLTADWDARGWSEGLGCFDLVLGNPPYVEDDAPIEPDVRRWEPAEALFAGPDGLEAYRALIPQLPALLTEGGAAVLEIGAAQAEAVEMIAFETGFSVEVRRDLGNRPRAVILKLGLGR
jgi:release factor glutamine methyltransferase